jgi:hypothetical protein
MGRCFDRELECGCLISTDGGGGCIPCCYPTDDDFEEQSEKCSKAWAKWKKTRDYKDHWDEIRENNR